METLTPLEEFPGIIDRDDASTNISSVGLKSEYDITFDESVDAALSELVNSVSTLELTQILDQQLEPSAETLFSQGDSILNLYSTPDIESLNLCQSTCMTQYSEQSTSTTSITYRLPIYPPTTTLADIQWSIRHSASQNEIARRYETSSFVDRRDRARRHFGNAINELDSIVEALLRSLNNTSITGAAREPYVQARDQYFRNSVIAFEGYLRNAEPGDLNSVHYQRRLTMIRAALPAATGPVTTTTTTTTTLLTPNNQLPVIPAPIAVIFVQENMPINPATSSTPTRNHIIRATQLFQEFGILTLTVPYNFYTSRLVNEADDRILGAEQRLSDDGLPNVQITPPTPGVVIRLYRWVNVDGQAVRCINTMRVRQNEPEVPGLSDELQQTWRQRLGRIMNR